MITAKRAKDQSEGTRQRLAVDEVKVMQRVMSFELFAKDTFARAAAEESSGNSAPSGKKALIEGVKIEDPSSKQAPNGGSASKTVLSLFGNAPTPRQLFSSLQRGIAPDIPLEELGLPNMLTASRLLPVQGVQPRDQSPKPTFSQTFAPPASFPTLQPPKPFKQAAHRSLKLAFVPGDAFPRSSRKGSYPSQSLNTGDWLAYGTSERNKDPASPNAKRKQRDRSLSTGERMTFLGAEEAAVESAAKEETLFHAAFSSFAPSYDNTKAIIPEDSRNMVWWRKAGSRRFVDHFALDPALSVASATLDGSLADSGKRDESVLFEEAITNFDGESLRLEPDDESLQDEVATADDNLEVISELLQTLSSYQRLRGASTVMTSKAPTSPNPLLGTTQGTPTEPSSDETSTYKVLRSRLADLIERLPPYLVAKLDGQQLEDLLISKKMIMENKQYKGVMEEDQITRTARSNAAAAVNLANRASAAAASQAHGQLGRTSSAANAPSRSIQASSSVYGGSRTPAASYARSGAGQSINGTPQNTGNRPAYAQLGSFTAPVNRAASSQQKAYGSGNAPQFPHQRPAYGQQYSQGSPQPQPHRSNNYTNPGQAAYQPNRVQNTSSYAQNAVTSNLYPRSDSPAKPIYSAQANLPRPVAPAPISVGQQQQQHMNGSGRSTPTYPQSQSTAAPSGLYSGMTTEQQRMLLERQRAQLAAQPQARMAAQGDAARQGTSTPQPSQPPLPPQPSQQINGVAPGP